MNPLKLIPAPYNWIAGLVAVLLVVVVIMTMGAKIGAFISDPFGWVSAGHEQNRVDAATGKAGTAASDAAAGKTSEQAARDAANNALTQENRDAILSAPDAAAPAGAAGSAGAASLCKRCSIYRDPRYSGLCRPYPAPAAC